MPNPLYMAERQNSTTEPTPDIQMPASVEARLTSRD
jgi:hypothetical protein